MTDSELKQLAEKIAQAVHDEHETCGDADCEFITDARATILPILAAHIPLSQDEPMTGYEATALRCIAERFPEGFSGGNHTAWQIEQIWRNGFSAAWMHFRAARPTADETQLRTVAEEVARCPICTLCDWHYAQLTARPCTGANPCTDKCDGETCAAQPVVENEPSDPERRGMIELCRAYFEIAAEVIGEDEVRRRRDDKMRAAIERAAQPEEKE